MNGPKNRRWTCGEHPGVMAPGRMRKEDVRRFCWQCSQAAGVLVRRTCPALDRKRESSKSRQVTRRKAEATTKESRRERDSEESARRVAARVAVAGDLDQELRELWPHAIKVATRPRFPKVLPSLTLTNHPNDSNCTGRAWYGGHRLHVGVALAGDRGGAVGTLAHEVAHLVTPRNAAAHGDEFWANLLKLVEAAYGLVISPRALVAEPTAWRRQHVVEVALEAHLADTTRAGPGISKSGEG